VEERQHGLHSPEIEQALAEQRARSMAHQLELQTRKIDTLLSEVNQLDKRVARIEFFVYGWVFVLSAATVALVSYAMHSIFGPR
jgi:hypothetical protein